MVISNLSYSDLYSLLGFISDSIYKLHITALAAKLKMITEVFDIKSIFLKSGLLIFLFFACY